MLKEMLKNHKEWNKQVQRRDRYVCQCCGEIGVPLNAHHLEEDIYGQFDPDKGITLCNRCHRTEHGRFKGKSTFKEIYCREGKVPSSEELRLISWELLLLAGKLTSERLKVREKESKVQQPREISAQQQRYNDIKDPKLRIQTVLSDMREAGVKC